MIKLLLFFQTMYDENSLQDLHLQIIVIDEIQSRCYAGTGVSDEF